MDEIIRRIKEEKDIFTKAKLIRHLLREKDFRIKDLANKLSYTSSYICHLNRLNKLPEIIVDGYYSKLVSVSHLFIISRIKDKDKMIEIYEKILTDNLTIKQTEDLVMESLYQIKNKGNYIDSIEKDRLIKKIKSKIQDLDIVINQKRTQGKIVFQIKGNLQKTSKKIREIVDRLTK